MNLRRKFLRADVYDREPEIVPATEPPREVHDRSCACRECNFERAQHEKALSMGAKRMGPFGPEWA